MSDNQPCDQQITSIADAVFKLKELRESNKNLNEPDIEERFARLALAFKTDKSTLHDRLDLQLRQRDISEKNIESELRSLRDSLNALNQLCTESDMREIITKTQQHVDIVEQATKRMSNRAETYGAIQQEQRMNCAFETMLNYVEHLKLLYDKEHMELEEYRRLLAEHNLLPGEKGSPDGDDTKRNLPPRSHSLSSTSKPEFLRRGSWGTFFRPPHSESYKVISRENSAGHLPASGLNMGLLRQKLESRTRLLSSVCLLNNNYDTPRTSASGTLTSSSGSISPKSRRSSLPVGPITYSQPPNNGIQQSGVRTHSSINEHVENKKESGDSHVSNNGRNESVDSVFNKEEAESVTSEKQAEEEKFLNKDSSELNCSNSQISCVDQENNSNLVCSLQESTCDNEIEEIRLLPEISIPVKSKPLYLVNLVRWTSLRHIWQCDNATLILHARYTASAILATAAMLIFVLTFVPNQVLALVMKDLNKDL